MAPYGQIESLSEDALLKLETQLRADIHDETDYSRLLRWRLCPRDSAQSILTAQLRRSRPRT
jgi:hypothetical protein